MRHYCKTLFIVIVCALAFSGASAESYSREWKEVNKLLEQDLPESAAQEIYHIWDMAAADGDGRQMLKSAVALTQVQQSFAEKSVTEGIELFSALLSKLQVSEHKALCHAFLAKGYLKYWQSVKNRNRRSLPTNEANPPLERWSAQMICDTICHHLQMAIELAGDVPAGYYKEFFPGGNKAGQKLRPLLADMLMDDALVLLTDYKLAIGKRSILNDRRLYSSMQDFVGATMNVDADDPDLWMLYVLRRLSQNNMTSNSDIRCTIDIRRFSILSDFLSANSNNNWSVNDDRWIDGVVNLALFYGKKVKFSTMFYSMAARKIQANIDNWSGDTAVTMQKRARDLCIMAQKKWPKSEGAVECLQIKDEIERKRVLLEREMDLLPGVHNMAKLTFRNVNTAYFKVVEVPSRLKNMDVSGLLATLNGSSPIVEWSMKVNNPGDYLDHYAFVDIPPVMQGCYYVLASTGPYFNSHDCVAYEYLECNGIRMASMVQLDGTVSGVALNVRNGERVPDCKYTVWRLNTMDEQVKIVTSGITGADGAIRLEGLERGQYRVELEAAESRGNATFHVQPADGGRLIQNAKIFTDRYSYRPGDSIQIAGMVCEVRDGDGSLMPQVPFQLSVADIDGNEKIVELVTDSLGLFQYTYQLSANVKPGRVFIIVSPTNYDEYMFQGVASVNVESFRQPAFEISINGINENVPYDTPITLTGNAVSNTGVPLEGAKVVWTASVYSFYCHKLVLPEEHGNVRVGGGELKTLSDGTFSLEFSVPSALMVSENCNVIISASVTDLNGETHSVSSSIIVGDEMNNLMINEFSSVSNGKKHHSLKFTLVGTNGFLDGQLNVKISRLAWKREPGLDVPFGVNSTKERHELAECAVNQSMTKNFGLYDFDFENRERTETVVYEGTLTLNREQGIIGELSLNEYESGEYMITATGPGNAKSTEFFTVCADDNKSFVPSKTLLWSSLEGAQSNNPRYKYVQVGDTVAIQLGNRLKGSVIHHVIETKDGIYRSGQIVSDGTRHSLRIPVTPELAGYFSIHCAVLYEGQAANVSYQCCVTDPSNELNVEYVSFRNMLTPDEQEEWQFLITDKNGNPVQANMLLDMYDSALDKYGVHQIALKPYSGVSIPYRTLLTTRYNYASLYEPWMFNSKQSFEYKGKRAVTGTLTNPFLYNPPVKRMKAMNRVDMGEFRGLGVTTVDEALQGRVAGLDLKMATITTVADDSQSIVLNEDISLTEEALESTDDANNDIIPIRSNLEPTALFELIRTDTAGYASVRFAAPQLLTRWNVKGLVFTGNLAVGHIDTTLVTRKQIMLEPAAPRFLREGDRIEFTSKVSSFMESDSKVEVVLTMTDAVTGRKLSMTEGASRKVITVPAGGNAATAFNVRVPQGLTAVTYVMTAKAGNHTDGVQQTLPVLSNRTQVVQAITLFNNGNEKRSFQFTELDRPRSQTMQSEQLTVEYSATPIWYALQALPSLIEVDDPSNLRLFHSMLGAAMSKDIIEGYPTIRTMLDEWAELPAGEWTTLLERNQSLSTTLLEETPWLRISQNERERMRALAIDMTPEKLTADIRQSLNRLVSVQNSDGGWSWLGGMYSSVHITSEILQGLGLLIENGVLGTLMENGVIDQPIELKESIQKGLDYLDGYYHSQYKGNNKPESLGYDELCYLLMRSYYKGYTFAGETRSVYTELYALALKQETHELALNYRASLAMLMLRSGQRERASEIVATIMDRSLYSDEMGRWWRDNTGGLLRHEAPIETQALIVRTLLAVEREDEAVEAARWLLKQRQTTGWHSSPATAAAVIALMEAGGDKLLEQNPDIMITVGRESLNTTDSKATAGYTVKSWQGPIDRAMSAITVESNSQGISWGSAYRSFTERLDKVEHQANGMSLERIVWRVVSSAQGDSLERVKPSTVLHVGDRLRIELNMATDRNLEYVQLYDMRAATFEPVSTRAGYRYDRQSDMGYYTAPGNTRNVFYIDRMGKGSYRIEYDVNVVKPGTFQEGIAVIQCLYAPAFRATTTSALITVE